MKNPLLVSMAAVAAAAMYSAPSIADTVADNEPVYSQVIVNTAAKSDLARSGYATYHNKTSIQEFDDRYKVRGQGMADKR